MAARVATGLPGQSWSTSAGAHAARPSPRAGCRAPRSVLASLERAQRFRPPDSPGRGSERHGHPFAPSRMTDTPDISITLTIGQIAQVVQESTDAGPLERILAGLDSVEELRRVVLALLDQGQQYSRPALRSLLVLSALPLDGTGCELTEIAAATGLATSSLHRYLNTWKALGIVQQDPQSRQYRRRQGLPITQRTG
jgi:hypothetical protein